MRQKTVVIIDDEEMLSAMLMNWVSCLKSFKVVGTANRGVTGVQICRKLKPDIAILDIEMPEVDGLEVARQLLKEVPGVRIVILTSHLNPYCVYEVAQLGLHGYLNKTDSLDVLREALCTVAAGQQFYSPMYHALRSRKMTEENAFQKILTPKETALLILLSQGASDTEIGNRLRISTMTVATHRRNIRTKLNIHNDRDLIRYAQEWGLFPLHPTNA